MSERPKVDPAVSPMKLARITDRLRAEPEADFFSQLALAGIDPERQLRGANLSGLDLYRLDFSKVDLTGADLSRCDLTKTRFDDSLLDGATMRMSRIEQASLRRVQASGIDLAGASLRKANLSDSVLDGANLAAADLLGARLAGTFIDRDWGDFAKVVLTPANILAPWPGSAAWEVERAAHIRAREENLEAPPPQVWDREEPLQLDARALTRIGEMLLKRILEGQLLRNAAIDPARYGQPDLVEPYAGFLIYTHEEIGEKLDSVRSDLLVKRREMARGRKELGVAEFTVRLGDMELLTRNYREAGQFYEQALDFYRGARRGELVAMLHGKLACLGLERMDRQEAIKQQKKSLELFESVGHREGHARAYLSMALLALLFHDKDRAGPLLEKSREIDMSFDREHLNERRNMVLGAVAWRAGDLERAGTVWSDAAETSAAAGAPTDARMFRKLAEIAAARQDLA